MKRVLLFFSVILLCNSCRPELTNDFTFLVGSWKADISDSVYLLETWEQVDDKNYKALTYEVSDSGMNLSEQITIEITDSGTFYKPTIEALSGGHEFTYTFVSQDDDHYIFENKKNGVTVIWYKIIDSTHLEAGIQKEKGKDEFVLSFEKTEE